MSEYEKYEGELEELRDLADDYEDLKVIVRQIVKTYLVNPTLDSKMLGLISKADFLVQEGLDECEPDL